MEKKTVFITGSSSGIGKLAVKTFQAKGWNVIATMRTPEKEEELTKLENVLVTRLDVQDQDSINNAVEEGMEKFGQIDVLVNNAGYGGHGQIEQFSAEAIQKMYETNVFGPIKVMQAVLPDMRKRKNGCIINITSAAGLMGIPNISVYCSTKWALEGLSEAMAFDCKPFGIQVKTVALGGYGTGFNAATDNHFDSGDEELQKYSTAIQTHLYENVMRDLGHQEGQLADPQEVADKIYECATEETPVHNVIGKDAEMLVHMKTSMSQQEFIDKISNMLLPKEKIC